MQIIIYLISLRVRVMNIIVKKTKRTFHLVPSVRNVVSNRVQMIFQLDKSVGIVKDKKFDN